MALEDLEGLDKFLDALVITNPTDQDKKKEGAAHLRGIKNVLINTFGPEAAAFNFFLEAHPIGSVYISAGIDPNSIGGTWTRVAEGQFLIGVGTLGSDTYAQGATGGEAKHTLTVQEMPAHTHTYRVNGGTTTPAAAVIDASATNANAASSSTGDGDPHENRPPYIAMDMWQRTA